jgi:hypothetical protein
MLMMAGGKPLSLPERATCSRCDGDCPDYPKLVQHHTAVALLKSGTPVTPTYATTARAVIAARVHITHGMAALGQDAVERIVKTIAVSNNFCHANDPNEEHASGSFEIDGIKYGITERGKRKGRPYIFINFGPRRWRIVKISIWSESLEKQKDKPTKSWVRRWVSVTGLLDPSIAISALGTDI